jgi:hypothetical protein
MFELTDERALAKKERYLDTTTMPRDCMALTVYCYLQAHHSTMIKTEASSLFSALRYLNLFWDSCNQKEWNRSRPRAFRQCGLMYGNGYLA